MKKKLLALALGLSMTAGTFVPAYAEEDPAELRLVMYGTAGTRNTEFWENEFHEKILEDLNIDLSVEYVPWGEGSVLTTMLASGEKFGLMTILSGSQDLARKGLLATFDEEMIKEVAPDYLEARMGLGFEFTTYKGDILSIPMGAIAYSGAQDNFTVRNDILNQVGWDYTQIETYDDLMDAIAAVHAEFPDLTILASTGFLSKALSSVYAPGTNFKPEGFCVIDESKPDSDEVINWYESEYFEKLCKMMQEWHELGYIDMEYLTDVSFHKTEWDNDKALLNFGAPKHIYLHSDATDPEGMDRQYLSINDTPCVMTRNYDWGFSASIADQDNTENWMRLFNWIYESEENYRFALYGVEGKDYEVGEDGKIERLTEDQFIYTWQCSTLLYEDLSMYDPEEVEAYLNFDSNSVVSKAAGFSFDSTPVQAQEAALSAIIGEKIVKIGTGLGDFDAEFPAILEELKANGLDEYVAEYQRQFSEFMASK